MKCTLYFTSILIGLFIMISCTNDETDLNENINLVNSWNKNLIDYNGGEICVWNDTVYLAWNDYEKKINWLTRFDLNGIRIDSFNISIPEIETKRYTIQSLYPTLNDELIVQWAIDETGLIQCVSTNGQLKWDLKVGDSDWSGGRTKAPKQWKNNYLVPRMSLVYHIDRFTGEQLNMTYSNEAYHTGLFEMDGSGKFYSSHDSYDELEIDYGIGRERETIFSLTKDAPSSSQFILLNNRLNLYTFQTVYFEKFKANSDNGYFIMKFNRDSVHWKSEFEPNSSSIVDLFSTQDMEYLVSINNETVNEENKSVIMVLDDKNGQLLDSLHFKISLNSNYFYKDKLFVHGYSRKERCQQLRCFEIIKE